MDMLVKIALYPVGQEVSHFLSLWRHSRKHTSLLSLTKTKNQKFIVEQNNKMLTLFKRTCQKSN